MNTVDKKILASFNISFNMKVKISFNAIDKKILAGFNSVQGLSIPDKQILADFSKF